MAAHERLELDVLARTAQAEAGLQNLGRKAAAASDDVMALAKRLDEIGRKSATARVGLEGDKQATAKLDALDLKMARVGNRVMDPKVTVEGTAKAAIELGALDAELDRMKASAEAAAGSGGKTGLAALAGGGGAGAPGAMGVLAIAGVALAPVVASVGTGLVGLGAAAYGIAKPIINAAQATGGLQKNMAKLNPEQQRVAKGLLSLGHDFGAFQKQMQPAVFTIFNKGLGLARTLLHGIQPVAASTGKALGGVLGNIDAEFKSGTWQQFFGFMARTAGPDLQQIGKLFVSLMQVLPPLLEALQPIGKAFLTMGDDAATALVPISRELKVFSGNVQGSADNFSKSTHAADNWFTTLTNHIPGVHAVNDWLTRVQHSLGYMGQSAQGAAPPVHHVAQSLAETKSRITEVISPLDHMGRVADTVKITQDNWGKVLHRNNAELFAQAHALNVVAGTYEHALTPLENYISASITEANDLHQVNIALRASGDRIGYKTQKERDSFATVQTYITDTLKQANAALAAHKGIDAQITSIERALPRLEQVKGKTADYKAELDLLKGILDKLRAERLIQEKIAVTGRGTWNVQGLPGPISAHVHGAGHAAGWRVPGYGGGDRWPALLEGGEAVVPKHLTTALAPFLKAHQVPGFAAGGIMGSYGPGSPAGLPQWTASNQHATVVGITNAIGKSFASSLASALASQAAIGGTPGPGGGSAAANAALAHRLYAAQLTPQSWTAWNYVAMRESGWNQFARNPSSGAYGIAQALPPTKYPFAGQAAGGSNPMAQITWMWNYMASRYGGPLGAAAHEAGFNWYGDGLHATIRRPTLIGVAERGPERVDVTPMGARHGGSGPLVHIENYVANDETDVALLSQRLSFAITAASLGS